ncbi:MAG TPA: DUF2125 domain-containing protein [Rhizomicrobium sp.]|nr:DUF2125 domain-containing protein [Rhizomicrobium sp.]
MPLVFKYSSRFWLYAPISLFLLLAVIVMVHWWIAAGAFEKKLAALKGHEAIPGVTIDWTSAEVGGFPFRMDADFTNLRIQGAGAHGPFAWTSEKFALHALTYGRKQVVYEAAGRQQASWTWSNGKVQNASFLPATMRGSSILDGKGLSRFDLDIVNLGGNSFTIDRLQFHMRRDPDGSDLDLMFKTDGLQLAGLKADNLELYATLSQLSALMPLLRGETSWPEAAKSWRAQGGTAKLSKGLLAALSPVWRLSPLY